MTKYKVKLPVRVWLEIEVEANDRGEAHRKAVQAVNRPGLTGRWTDLQTKEEPMGSCEIEEIK